MKTFDIKKLQELLSDLEAALLTTPHEDSVEYKCEVLNKFIGNVDRLIIETDVED